MGVSKTQLYTKDQNEMAVLLKAMAHPARIAIIEYLQSINSCICNDIVNEIKLSQPTVSQHLKELKNANIIKGEIEGNAICYCINPKSLEKIEFYLQGLLKKIETQTNCCK